MNTLFTCQHFKKNVGRCSVEIGKGIRYNENGKLYENQREHFKMNYIYIVKCKDGTLYTGWTNHLENRIKAHNEGKGAKYTRARRPVELVYYEQLETKEEAMRREYAIKRLTRMQKMKLIEGQR